MVILIMLTGGDTLEDYASHKANTELKALLDNSPQEIERLLGEKVNLRLWVKVQHNWRSDPNFLKRIGYDKKEL